MSFVVALVSSDPAFSDRIIGALLPAVPPSWRGIGFPEGADIDLPEGAHPTLAQAVERGRSLLESKPEAGPLHVVRAATRDEVPARLRALCDDDATATLGLLLMDAPGERSAAELNDAVGGLLEGLEALDVPVLDSPYLAHFFIDAFPQQDGWYNTPATFLPHLPHDEDWVHDATAVCALFDAVDRCYLDRRARRHVSDKPLPLTLTHALFDFMVDRAGTDWQLYYYTGSPISSSINTADALAKDAGVLRLRGPSEHSLAAGAEVSWMMHGRPSLILITSAMVDEFRGTLANLRTCQAKTIILAPENDRAQWFAFQGTMTVDEDSREALQARRTTPSTATAATT